MTLRIHYTHFCDFCKMAYQDEDNHINLAMHPYTVPQPLRSNMFIGTHMACPLCFHKAHTVLIDEVKARHKARSEGLGNANAL